MLWAAFFYFGIFDINSKTNSVSQASGQVGENGDLMEMIWIVRVFQTKRVGMRAQFCVSI